MLSGSAVVREPNVHAQNLNIQIYQKFTLFFNFDYIVISCLIVHNSTI